MGLGEDSGDIIPPQGKIGDCGEEVSDQNLPISPHVPRASLVQNHLPLVHEEWKKETLRWVGDIDTKCKLLLYKPWGLYFDRSNAGSHSPFFQWQPLTFMWGSWVGLWPSSKMEGGYHFLPGLGVGSRDGDVAKIFHSGWIAHFWGCCHHPVVLEPEADAARVVVCWWMFNN